LKYLRSYYGTTLLNETDLVESSNNRKMELHYYETKEHSIKRFKKQTFYGIEIVKKEYEKDKVKLEKNSIKKVSTNENIIKQIIEMLEIHKVTPIGLEDVLTDLMKQPQFQEN